jgi:Fe-S cluster assembly iron-binding protein IscA
MTLDEQRNTDTVFDIDGFRFLVDKELMREADPVNVDFSGFGFQFDCGMDFNGGCSACATSTACSYTS